MARNEVKIDTHRLTVELNRFEPKVDRAITALFDYQATRTEAWMKQNARWTDRTTNARNGLFTATAHARGHHTMLLSHGVSYGIFLETRFAGRYEIINPALAYTSLELRKLMMRLMAEASRL